MEVSDVRGAVVGHVEWVTFVRVERLPATGDIVHAGDWWEEPGGGGAGAAVQMAKLCGGCDFFTALGDDELGHRAVEILESHGVTMHASFHPKATRRAITHLDPRGERTITVLGERLEPRGLDALPWEELARADAVYVTAADVSALQAARKGRALVATSRVLPVLRSALVQLDALVGSAKDPSEAYMPGDLDPPPRLVVRTEGSAGGTLEPVGQPAQRYSASALPGPVVDSYGAGDSFAAGLTYALGAGLRPVDAVALAARCGAAAVTGRGPYEGQARLSSVLA